MGLPPKVINDDFVLEVPDIGKEAKIKIYAKNVRETITAVRRHVRMNGTLAGWLLLTTQMLLKWTPCSRRTPTPVLSTLTVPASLSRKKPVSGSL
jgi:hypothetical protein